MSQSGPPATPPAAPRPIRVWILTAAVLVAGVSLAFSQLGVPELFKQKPTLVETWYADPGYQVLIPVVRHASARMAKGEALVQEGLNLMREPPAGLVSPIPAESRTRLVFGRGAEATVEIEIPRPVGSGEERLIVGALVRTVLALSTVPKVRVVLSNPLYRHAGGGHEDLSRAFGPESPEVRNSWDGETGTRITAWFLLTGTPYLVPLDMASPIAEKPIEGTLAAIAAGPPVGIATLEPVVPKEAGLRFVGRPASDSIEVEWTRPDFPDDPLAKRRLLAATVLSLTDRWSRTVVFRSPGGRMYRKIGDINLSNPLGRDDVLSVLQADLTQK